MNKFISNISFKSLTIVSIVLLLFSLLYHLSYMVFIGDESIRSLVAFEMLESGNYLVPKINGEFYYFKPPIYNWFIALSFYIFGEVSEFSARFPTVVFTFLFGYCIYTINKKYFGHKFGVLSALMVLTCGRILFWDSMLGLIDIGYSVIVYVQIYMVYHLFQKQKILQLFLVTYLLTAIGFLMKGYPSLVFQALSVGTWFIYNRKFRLLFSLRHIAGIVLMASIIGGYYFIYSHFNDAQNTVTPLLDQALRRTASRFDFIEIIQHIISYPFENVYHFLPWSLLILLLIRKDILQRLKSNSFITFNALMFLINIFIYWISPEVYPRYILMLIPFIFTVFLYLYMYETTEKWNVILTNYTMKGLVMILPIGVLASYIIPSIREVEFHHVKIITLSIIMTLLAYMYHRRKALRIIIFILMLIFLRIGFDAFILYDRKHYGHSVFYKNDAIRIAKLVEGNELNIYKNSRVHFIDSYYIMSHRNKSMHRARSNFKQDQFYIFDTSQHDNIYNMTKVDSFKTWEDNRTLFIVHPNTQE